jgi:transformation/transcription domain-associated protein
MAERSLETLEGRLRDPATDLKTKANLLIELRDSLEIVSQASGYSNFLTKFVPLFFTILADTPICLTPDDSLSERKVRQHVLEILHRLPVSPDPQVMEPFGEKIIDKCMQLVEVEAEDNAVLCLKIIMDFCRHHVKTLPTAEKFLQLILNIFDSMPQRIRDTFDASASQPAAVNAPANAANNAGTPDTPSASAGTANGNAGTAAGESLPTGSQSFKVIAECPIIVVSIFQNHRPIGPKQVVKFTPRIKAALLLQAPAQKKAHDEAKQNNTIFTGIAKEYKTNRQITAFGDMITAQVKTMSFLAYLLRAYQSTMTDFLPHLPDLVVRLLRDVPRSHTATRKELLVAIRHIINFNFRKQFLPVILPLLDSRTLVGDSLTADATLRPLAYTMLADLIHHVREQLSSDQIAHVVHVYVNHLTGDDGVEVPGTSYQTMSAKLLLNMAECMSKMPEKKDARYLMITVLNGIADKFAAMNRAYPNAVKISRQQAEQNNSATDAPAESYLAVKEQKPDWDETDILNAMPIKATNPRDRATDPVTENKFLFKNLLQGLRQFFTQLRNSNPPRIKEDVDPSNAPPHWSELSSGFEAEEVNVLVKLFREGAKCFQYYAPLEQASSGEGTPEPSSSLSQTANSKEEKDLLESFATIFHNLDPATFHEIFTSGTPSGLEFLYCQNFEHPALLHVPQFLLASEATSAAFCGMLLKFLMGKLEEVGENDNTKTSVLLRLFKLSFMAVTLFSTHNEAVLLPHVRDLITRSIELSVTAENPTNYFLLLRSLFRSIGGGRFEHLYKEILPLLEMLLEVLNTQLAAASDGSTRDLFVELSLTVPARLSHLLPHLSYLMRPLTVALRAGEQPATPNYRGNGSPSDKSINPAGVNELTAQGLRTLELCVDNLTADYLDPIMQPWMYEIMGSLWRMLRPVSVTGATMNNGQLTGTGHMGAHTAVRILGKLGGRNRKFLTAAPELEWRTSADDAASFDVNFNSPHSIKSSRAMPAHLGVDSAIDKLWDTPSTAAGKKSDEFYKRHAFKLITSHVKLLIGSDNLPDDLARLIRLQADDLASKNFDFGSDLFSTSDTSASMAKRDEQKDKLLRLIKALIHATSIDFLKPEADKILLSIYRHFMLIELGTAVAKEKHANRPFDSRSGDGPVYIDTAILANAICDSLASSIKDVRESAEKAMVHCYNFASTIFGSESKVESLPFFAKLVEVLSHACYEEEWFTKNAGSFGLAIMLDVKKLPFSNSWIAGCMHDMLKALLYVVKDMPQELPANIRVQASQAVIALATRFGKSGLETKDDLESKDSKLNMLANRLIGEVNHMNRHVRETSQTALRELAVSLDMPLVELLNPVKELCIAPIFMKPLRALPFAAQIGYIDAIDFMLTSQGEKEIIIYDGHLDRLIQETMALVDAEDESLAQKPQEYRPADSIVRLRVAGLRLLTTAIKMPGFNASNTPGRQGQAQTRVAQDRARVISIFFKSLYSKNKDVAASANAGLQHVLSSNSKLPKDLLQNGLRPILMNVQDAKRLSVEGLEGLRTLLQLLHNYFKVEIGTRLLDHMKAIADKTTLQRVSFSLIESQPKMRVVTAIFSVFHLLPSQASQFLPDLVLRVMDLEAQLRRTRNSPFRAPLIQYLNHYPAETWAFFGRKFKEEALGRFFAQILGDSESGVLREKVISEPNILVQAIMTEQTDADRAQAAVNAIHVAYSICQYPETEKTLLANKPSRDALLNAAQLLRRQQQQNKLPKNLRLAAIQSGGQIMEIITAYLAQHPEDLDGLFNVVSASAKGDLHACPSLYAFLYTNVITSTVVNQQRAIMSRCIDIYASKDAPQKLKWFVFHHIFNPILANDAQRNWSILFIEKNKGTPLLDRSLFEQVHSKLWKGLTEPEPESTDGLTLGTDHTRMELLQTSAFLIKYHHEFSFDFRKDIIKFGWNWIKLEDHINKFAAYGLIAYFIHFYDTPSKIAMQVYNALLRAHQAEGRNLVMQSLEIIEPVMKKRFDTSAHAVFRVPKRIITEELNNTQQLTCIYHFIVRHPDLFYESRQEFSSNIITTMSKVAPVPNSSVESRKLALNLFTLIWQWEERTVREQGSLATADAPKKGAVANVQLRLIFIKYMVHFIATSPERFPALPAKSDSKEKDGAALSPPSPSTEIVCKSLDILHKLLSAPYWDDVDIDNMIPKVTETFLTTDQKSDEKYEVWLTRVINTTQVVKVMLNSRSDDWVLARLPLVQKLLGKALRSEVSEYQAAVHNADFPENIKPRLPPVLQRALEPIPVIQSEEDLPDADSPTDEFIGFLNTMAGDLLNNGNHVPAINILWAMAQRHAQDIDTHIPALLRILQTKLAKDHITHSNPNSVAPGETRPAPPTAQEVESTVHMVVKVIEMLSDRMTTLGESRRPYLSVLASLVERSSSNEICEKILAQVEDWVFNPAEPVPTLKEKTAVLQKMLLFENRADHTLYNKFLNLVIRIYEDPKITRSELAVRLEQAFLVGLRSQDVEMRARFVTIFDKALSRFPSNRFFKLICEQQWDVLGDSFWLSQVIQLMFGTIEQQTVLHLAEEDSRCLQASRAFNTYNGDSRLGDVMVDDGLEELLVHERLFMAEIGNVRSRDVLVPLSELQHTDWQLAHDIWIAFFPMCWSILSRDDREDVEQGLMQVLVKDYHQRQMDRRPNCVATLLEAIAKSQIRVKFPPHLMKYLLKQYDAWYVGATYMEDLVMKPIVDTPNVRESALDALVETYAGLEERDLFYGVWRRRAAYVETNAALSYEQNGIWDKAQTMYEQAQVKARTASLPYSQGEYMLWEDQWVLCAQKLQQWEILGEFAKHENINDLYLEAMWRNFDTWSTAENREHLENVVKAVSDAPTPRRLFFQSFISLLKMHNKSETQQEFARICDENIQLSIKNWHKLPRRITTAHIGLLENFQQLVELHDASVICQSLAQTTSTNLDVKSQELKVLLSTWRDRLPNTWDDINAWQDIVTWRQHIFNLINSTYLPLLPQNAPNNAAGSSYGYRGFHETAWIINRFAHVARKHEMPDVCIQQLGKIYTLPNIEIQEAFLKLREQAKCHYQNRSELTSGLEVINNTNLNYFQPQQKAEFYTLKGMFLSKLNQKDDATDAFGTALFFDIKLPKAWAEWGRYSDNLFKEEKTLEHAGNALSCYLEASGQYKSAKSRKLLSRILWLLSLDDASGTLAKKYNDFKGDHPWWYWVTFIPQLLANLSRTESEADIAHVILNSLAKTYPQALHFQLRTTHEDMQVIRKSQEQRAAKAKAAESVKQESPAVRPGSASSPQAVSRPGTANGEATPAANKDVVMVDDGTKKEEVKTEELPKPKKPWEHTDRLEKTLRTAFPLLYASMEAMVEQIQRHFKCPPDEDAYRLIVALLNDALSYINRSPHSYSQDAKLPPSTEANITRFAESILPAHIRKSFEADFVANKPTMQEYINKLRKWRDKMAELLDRKPSSFHLAETIHLVGFRFIWFDDVEIPGQYLQHKDKNQDFVRIERFIPVVDLVRGVTACHRRLKIRGHDGSVHPFAVQHPTPRHSRREERVVQLFRIFNSTLSKKKESRRRNLQFHLPFMVPLSPAIRLIQDDASYITLQGIYDDHCRRHGQDKDAPLTFTMEKWRTLSPNRPEQWPNVKLESLNYVQQRYAEKDLVRQYFSASYTSFDDFWLFRRQFSYQLAALTYMTFTMFMTTRYPSKMHISRRSGNIWGSELISFISPQRPLLHQPEPVPFRLTPNLQVLMGPIHTEGIFVAAVMAIARCLTSDITAPIPVTSAAAAASATGPNGTAAPTPSSVPDSTNSELEHHLSIFIRDEMQFWYMSAHRQVIKEDEMRANVLRNSEAIVNKAVAIAKEPTANNIPASQCVLDLIAKATNPEKLAQADLLWMPWL